MQSIASKKSKRSPTRCRVHTKV